jgi:hypothetical protein
MAEPARKLDDIEPDIKPSLSVIDGGGETDSRRASLRALNSLETNPEKREENSPVDEQERNGSNVIPGPWTNNVNGTGSAKQKIKGKFLGGKGPIALIITLVFGGAVGLGGLFGGNSLILVNFVEVLTGGKNNLSLGSLANRSSKIMALKLKGGVSGICSSSISVMCKYNSLTPTNIDGLNKEGVSVLDSNKNEISSSDETTRGKIKPSFYSFEGKVIPAEQFASELGSNTDFLTAVQNGMKYEPEYASLSGKIWAKFAGVFGISKKAPFDDTTDTTDDKRLATVEADTEDPVTLDANDVPTAASDDCGEGTECTQAQIDEADQNRTQGVTDLTSAESATTKAVTGELATVGETVVEGAEDAEDSVSVDGIAQNACSFYGTVRTIGDAAKTVRALQLAKYAMIFLTTASMIKAGNANSGDVAYLAGILTALYAYKNSRESATDTLAYRNKAFGDTGTLDTTANQFLTGGGLVGDLNSALNIVFGLIGGQAGANRTCNIVNNPVVQGGALIAGVVAWIFPVSDAGMTAKEVGQIALQTVIAGAEALLPGMLKDVIAGKLIDKTIVGAAAGDALVSGIGAIMSDNAQYGGNAPLTPDQAVAYNDLQDQTADQIADQDRKTANPLDASDPNTFLGTMFTYMSQYSSGFSSITGALSSTASLVSGSFGSLVGSTAKADSASNYTTCQDSDYSNIETSVVGGANTQLATDLFCNPERGIPPVYLDAAPDPSTLTQQFIDGNEVDPITGDPLAAGAQGQSGLSDGAYSAFVDNCINRDQSTPLGDGEPGANGSTCFITNQATANYYIHFIDQRALDQMENGMDDDTSGASTATQATTQNTTQPLNTVSLNRGWTLQNNIDYSGTACDSRTTDLGIYKNTTDGDTVRLCEVVDFPSTSGGDISTDANVVSSLISTNVENMFLAAKTAGVSLGISSGMRSMTNQYYTASSQHSRGLAMDLGSPRGGQTICFIQGGEANGAGAISSSNAAACRKETNDFGTAVNWLDANAATYGFFNLTGEPWHWSTSGD